MSNRKAKINGLTRQRKTVLEAISNSERHLTPNEIFEISKMTLPAISLATVYNSVRYLKSAELIATAVSPDGTIRYDRNTDRHDHAVCDQCGEISDLDLEITDGLFADAIKRAAFGSTSIEVTIRGKCAKCLR